MVLFVIIVAAIIIGIMSNELKDTKSYYEKELKKYKRQYLVMPLQSNWQRHQIQALECVSSNLTRGTDAPLIQLAEITDLKSVQ